MHPRYDQNMRATISLEDCLVKQVRREAAAQNLSVRAFIARTLDDALKRLEAVVQRWFRLITVGGGCPLPGIDLDRPRVLDAVDDALHFGQ